MPPPEFIDPHWRPPVLPGERLRLRPLDERDVDALFRLASNPNVTRYTLWEAHRSPDETRAFLRDYALDHYRDGVPDPMGIVLADSDTLAGALGCHWASRKDRCMELGYWIGEPYWGRGLIVEAALLLVDHVFAEYPIERLQSHCFRENAASARVLVKLGFQSEGIRRRALWHRERFWDLSMFAMVREDWNQT